MSDWFVIPLGYRNNDLVMVKVVLSHPLKRGDLGRLAHQLLQIAAIAEEPLEGDDDDQERASADLAGPDAAGVAEGKSGEIRVEAAADEL